MSTSPIMTTIIISIVDNVCVNSSDRPSTTTTIVVVMVSINIKFRQIIVVRTSTRANAANSTIMHNN